MNLITFSPIDKYRRVQFVVYMVLIYMFVFMFGFTINEVSYKKECHKLFMDSKEVYTFSPCIETWEKWRESQFPYVKTLIDAEEGIDYDAGMISDSALFDNGTGLVLTEKFYGHLNMNLKAGTGFTENPNEVIIVNNRSGYKVGDTITVFYEKNGIETERELEVVGILCYPIMAEDVTGWSSYSGTSMDGNPPFGYYVCDYLRRYDNENVYLINPLLGIDADVLKEDIFYIYLEEDNIQTQSVLRTLMQYGDVEWMEALQKEKETFWDREEAVLEICLLLAFICGVIVYNYIDMKRRRREFGIYFMLGMTWRQTIRITVSSNVASFTLGFLLAEITLYRIRNFDFLRENIYLLRNQFLLGLGIFLIYILSMLPVYMEMRRVNPITLIRRKD